MAKKFFGGISLQDQSSLNLFDSDSSNSLSLRAPGTIGADFTLTLPDAAGSAGQALSTDGAGVLSWESFLSTTLTDGTVLIGNGSNVATERTISGDITIDNAGVAALAAGVVVDADVNASAAIALSKLAATTAGRALVSDGSGFVSPSAVTATELGFVSGVTSGIQSQIDTLSSSIQNFEWQESVIDKDLTAPPGGESAGDRYLVGLDSGAAVATGAWAGQDGNIAEYNGASWVFTTPTVGMFISADDEGDKLYSFGGTLWSAKYFESTTASTGLTKVGFDIRLDASAAGDGLAFAAGVLSVGVDDATVETNLDVLRLKDGGITNAKINAAAAIAFSKMEALAANRALSTDASGFLVASAVTDAELGHLDGVTSGIQAQLDGKAGTALDNLSVASLASQSLLVGSSASAVSSLAAGSNGQVLKVVGGVLAWADDTGSNTAKVDWVAGDGATKVVNHGLGTKDVMVQIFDQSDDASIEVDSVVRTDANNVTLTASSAPGASGWRVLVIEI